MAKLVAHSFGSEETHISNLFGRRGLPQLPDKQEQQWLETGADQLGHVRIGVITQKFPGSGGLLNRLQSEEEASKDEGQR